MVVDRFTSLVFVTSVKNKVRTEEMRGWGNGSNVIKMEVLDWVRMGDER